MQRAATWIRVLKGLPLLLISPVLTLVPALAFQISDLWRPRRRPRQDRMPDRTKVSIVIPNWNGRDLLEKFLPSVVAAADRLPGSEVIVVDNGSTDGSADWIRDRESSVRVVALPENRGFGGGSNAGFEAASHDIVVLLNNDMRPDPGFLKPLVDTFTDQDVFAASCQIFFSDPTKLREETGLTQGWWEAGSLRVRHRLDDQITEAYPCFYGGGGSCAFDRRKILELGGFDEVLAPFYLEDTDLGYGAWKRGWKVLYQPKSIVYHEHRGTIGRKFTPEQIQAVLKKNFLLFVWKNIHDRRWMLGHFFSTWLAAVVSLFAGDSPERANLAGLWRAFRQLPGAIQARRRAQALAEIDDREAFRRPLGGYYRDRFDNLPASLPAVTTVLVPQGLVNVHFQAVIAQVRFPGIQFIEQVNKPAFCVKAVIQTAGFIAKHQTGAIHKKLIGKPFPGPKILAAVAIANNNPR